MQPTILAVKNAIDAIKVNGLKFAGVVLTQGHLGIYRVPAEYGSAFDYYLVPLFADSDFPLRRIVKDADGSYRVASPHIGGEVKAKGISLEEASKQISSEENTHGEIMKIIEFGAGLYPEVATLPEEMDTAVVDLILFELTGTELAADRYEGVVISGQTAVALADADHQVNVLATLGEDGQLVTTEQPEILELASAILRNRAEIESVKPAIGAKRLQRNVEIIAACIKAKGKLVDGHGNGSGFTHPTHIATFGTPGRRELVVALYEGKNFCLNQIDLEKDGTPVVTSCSVGGNVFHPEQEMADRIHTYSDWDRNTLWNLIALGE